MPDRINLKDFTIYFPIKVDSIDRLENIKMVTEHILDFFNTNIHVLEAGPMDNGILRKLLHDNVTHEFVEDFDPIFHRTYYISYMVRNCHTPFLGIWDTDAIVLADQIYDSAEKLRNRICDFAYPYDGFFYDTSIPIKRLYLKTKDFKVLIKNQSKMKSLYGKHPCGGAYMANTASYIKSGIENTNFYGWGPEDGERFTRWKKLGFTVKRSKGDMYHLSHSRGINSSGTKYSLRKKSAEFERIDSMSKNELQKEVLSWGVHSK